MKRILLSTVLAAAACSSSGTTTPDATGTAGMDACACVDSGTAGTTGAGGGAAAGTTGAAGTGTDGGSDAADAPAADGGSDVTTTEGGSDAAGTTTKAFSAAAGGSLPVTGGAIKIPAGVLTADTMVSVTESAATATTPNKDQILGLIYDFGPNGTKFKTPIEMTLPLTGTVPAGKEAVIAYLDTATNVWVPLSSSVTGAAGSQKVYALVSHFTPFAVLLVTTGAVCPSTTACGGSMVGTWEIATFCQTKATKAVTVDCGDGTYNGARAVFDLTGTLTIAEGGAYTFNRTIHVDRLSNSSPACIVKTNTVRVPKIAVCTDIEADLNKEFSLTTTTCSGTIADGCTCYSPTPMPGTETGTIVATGNTYVTTKTGGQPGAPDSFCVKGNVLTVTTAGGDVFTGVKKAQ